ncbi:Hemolysin-type calcium-binding protein [Roseovarius sp. EC-HK134]|uniref:calcium-binding protein n=1 Tax=unclassified Roseovarius TaxID=2614913 RepID=UPI001259A429|nr:MULTISPECIES: calcium-binding protein [unclassified Roseovarius]VVT16166.1 Hemolysin-type calcium-binding protein [Roseovarius sp. EC-HK134]VVT16768.1 Hemolysin-type calcium-binding protein [Roseovarius sp. EC-SD190]
MAHVFDYSSSQIAIDEFTGHSLSNLFGTLSGTFLPAEFWDPLGTLSGVVSYSFEEFGEIKTGSFRIHLDGSGTFSQQSLSPFADTFIPFFYANDPELVTTDAFFTGQAQLTLFSFSDQRYLRFEGLPTLERSFGPLPSGPFLDFNAASEFAISAVTQANADHLASLQALQSASLATSIRIVAENFGIDPSAGAVRLVYTPDASTSLTFADWIGLDPSESNDAYAAQLVDTQSLFSNEDVEVVLTDFDDFFSDLGGGFAARRAFIDAGGGDDIIDMRGDSVSGFFSSALTVPLDVSVEGGEGNDSISTVVRNAGFVDGGSGNDTILASSLADGPTAFFEAHGGDGEDDIRGLDDGANLFFGGNDNDVLTGGFDSADTIHGGAGDDDIGAGSGFDLFKNVSFYSDVANLLYGDAGNDTIGGGNGADTLHGGDGDDYIFPLLGSDFVYGGAGLDTFSLTVGNSGFEGSDVTRSFGDKLIVDTGGILEFAPWMSVDFNTNLLERLGNDLVIGTLGQSSIRLVDFYSNPTGWISTSDDSREIDFARAATLSDSSPEVPEGGDTITGGDTDDTIAGSAGNDVLDGGAGNDRIAASDGDDLVSGGAGNDSIGGGLGNDTIDGGDGDDVIGGGFGADSITGGAGNDVVAGGAENDTLSGGEGNDSMSGSFGNDLIDAGSGADDIGGGTGRDTIDAGSGNDRVGGGEGDDSILGGAGNDFLAGGGRNDTIDGGTGNDTINGGAGNDVMTGGADADQFVFSAFFDGESDVITDFEDGIDSFFIRIVNPDTGVENINNGGNGLAGFVAAMNITDTAAGAQMSVNGNTILVEGIIAAQLTVDDFQFL